MKTFIAILLIGLCANAQAVTIWGATDRTPATATMRFPVDTGAASSPGYLDIADVDAYVTANMDTELTCLAALATTGIFVRTGAGTCLTRTITGTAQSITVTNGSGVSGNPTLAIASDYPGQASITTVGTIAAGVWNGTELGVAYGGSGLTSIANHNLIIGNGSNAFVATEVPDCDDSGGNHLNYNTGDRTFSCGTSSSGGGGGSPAGSGTEIQYRVDASTFGALGGSSVASNVMSLNISGSSATNAATATPITFDHTTSGTATTGFGFTIPYRLEDASGNTDVAANAVYSWVDATHTSEDTKIVWSAMKAGSLTAGLTIDPGNASGIVASIPIPSTGTDYMDLGQPKIGMLASTFGAIWLGSGAKSSSNYSIAGVGISNLNINSQASTADIIFLQATNVRGRFDTNGRFGVGTTTTFDRQLQNELSTSATNAVTYGFREVHNTSGTAAAGFGYGREVELEDAGGALDVAARENFFWADATAASEDGDYGLDLVAGGTLARRLTLTSTGNLTMGGTAAGVSSCGTSPSVVGDQTSGTITTGSGTPTSCVLDFNTTWAAAPVCTVTTNSTTIFAAVTAVSTTQLTLGFSAAHISGTVYYICIG